jgi:hypothetical protein
MKLEEIKSIMGVYENLIEFVKAKAKVLSNTHPKYCIYKGINSIYFEDDKVYVECDDSTYGSYETSTFSFPIEWLSMEDSELVSYVLDEHQSRLKRIAEANAAKILKEEKQREQSQFELYKQLKAKFENL